MKVKKTDCLRSVHRAVTIVIIRNEFPDWPEDPREPDELFTWRAEDFEGKVCYEGHYAYYTAGEAVKNAKEKVSELLDRGVYGDRFSKDELERLQEKSLERYLAWKAKKEKLFS